MPADRTVILDWDGTLAASIPDGIITRPVNAMRAMEINLISLPMDKDGAPKKQILLLRPYFHELILALSSTYNLALWTYGASSYIEYCIHATSLEKIFHGPNLIAREDMLAMKTRYKDIFLLKQRLDIRLTDTIIVDDSHFDFGVLNPINCVDVPTWYPEMRADTCLKSLPALIEQQFAILQRYSEEELIRRRDAILKSLET